MADLPKIATDLDAALTDLEAIHSTAIETETAAKVIYEEALALRKGLEEKIAVLRSARGTLGKIIGPPTDVKGI